MQKKIELISVMYHYFGDEDQYDAGIYPVSKKRFRAQLQALKKTYHCIGEEELIDALCGKKQLPQKSCLITFDDGLKTQYDIAVPILKEENVPAVFFPNTQPLKYHTACRVHKVHYLLSLLSGKKMYEEILLQYKKQEAKEFPIHELDMQLALKENKYDTDLTAKVKFILNSFLEPELANYIVDVMFHIHVPDEKEFCASWYMNETELRALDSDPLFFLGLHTESHIYFPYATGEDIAHDVQCNYDFLLFLGLRAPQSIAYPYGLVEEKNIVGAPKKILNKLGIVYGLTTVHGVNTDLDAPLFLKRFDTNDVFEGKQPLDMFLSI